MKESIAGILKREGYISDFAVEGKTAGRKMKLKLKYLGKKSVIEGLRRVSTPGLRRYVALRTSRECSAASGCRWFPPRKAS